MCGLLASFNFSIQIRPDAGNPLMYPVCTGTLPIFGIQSLLNLPTFIFTTNRVDRRNTLATWLFSFCDSPIEARQQSRATVSLIHCKPYPKGATSGAESPLLARWQSNTVRVPCQQSTYSKNIPAQKACTFISKHLLLRRAHGGKFDCLSFLFLLGFKIMPFLALGRGGSLTLSSTSQSCKLLRFLDYIDYQT
ncbi:hypothetical protein AOQ84DRAFT_126778 [Glonium stellatum]|uniref:Uncharacterized protein n=1 Tax=Glonium stellatum TaxID=574774 RepID=A0A8E2JNU8_9PEZI|nr:hypothetical protein AOQ84DRAFT_126778 [Glonium stellatum]